MDGEGRRWVKRRGIFLRSGSLYILKLDFEGRTIAMASESSIHINLMLSG